MTKINDDSGNCQVFKMSYSVSVDFLNVNCSYHVSLFSLIPQLILPIMRFKQIPALVRIIEFLAILTLRAPFILNVNTAPRSRKRQ